MCIIASGLLVSTIERDSTVMLYPASFGNSISHKTAQPVEKGLTELTKEGLNFLAQKNLEEGEASENDEIVTSTRQRKDEHAESMTMTRENQCV